MAFIKTLVSKLLGVINTEVDTSSEAIIQIDVPAKFQSGLTGALNDLPDGSPFLVAGTNITLATGSKGQVTINGAATASSYWTSSENNNIFTTGSVTIIGNTTVSGNLDISGSIVNFALKPRWCIWSQSGSITLTGSSHTLITWDKIETQVNKGLQSYLNTNNSKLVFSNADLSGVFTFKLDAILGEPNKDCRVHIDFDISGSVGGTENPHEPHTYHRQTLATSLLKNSFGDHDHFHMVGTFFVDNQMIASGAQFYGCTSDGPVPWLSSTLMLKEG